MADEPRDTESARTIIIRLTPETHKALRIRVAEEDTSIQKWVETLLETTLGLSAGGGKKPSRKSAK